MYPSLCVGVPYRIACSKYAAVVVIYRPFRHRLHDLVPSLLIAGEVYEGADNLCPAVQFNQKLRDDSIRSFQLWICGQRRNAHSPLPSTYLSESLLIH